MNGICLREGTIRKEHLKIAEDESHAESADCLLWLLAIVYYHALLLEEQFQIAGEELFGLQLIVIYKEIECLVDVGILLILLCEPCSVFGRIQPGLQLLEQISKFQLLLLDLLRKGYPFSFEGLLQPDWYFFQAEHCPRWQLNTLIPEILLRFEVGCQKDPNQQEGEGVPLEVADRVGVDPLQKLNRQPSSAIHEVVERHQFSLGNHEPLFLAAGPDCIHLNFIHLKGMPDLMAV